MSLFDPHAPTRPAEPSMFDGMSDRLLCDLDTDGPADREGDVKTVGFTGTRDGMSDAQRSAVEDWLVNAYLAQEPMRAAHGCCVGADAEFARIVRTACPRAHIVGWPSDMAGLTSKLACMCCDEIHDPQPPLIRNRCIVDECNTLLACPKGPEERRSGTWATVRYARKLGRPVVIFQPDGTVALES